MLKGINFDYSRDLLDYTFLITNSRGIWKICIAEYDYGDEQ